MGARKKPTPEQVAAHLRSQQNVFKAEMDMAENSRKRAAGLVKYAFPVGTPIRWRIGDHLQEGVIHDVSLVCVWVRNSRTGAVLRWDFDRLYYHWKNYNAPRTSD